MICEKVLKTPRLTAVANFEASWIVFLSCFLVSVESKKYYQRKSSALTHAVVYNNTF